MRKMASISSRLVSGDGFSNGCALFALKKPPPFVPSILMASCDAVGPWPMVCVAVTVVTGLPSVPVAVVVCVSTSLAVS